MTLSDSTLVGGTADRGSTFLYIFHENQCLQKQWDGMAWQGNVYLCGLWYSFEKRGLEKYLLSFA